MQEWIIAMLAISILLILRDMAKTILSGRKSAKNAEVFALCENHPRKEKVEKYAESFQKLADSFYGMPSARYSSASVATRLNTARPHLMVVSSFSSVSR